MKVLRNESGRKNREFWSFVDKTSREVDSWPSWKTGQVTASSPREPIGANGDRRKKDK